MHVQAAPDEFSGFKTKHIGTEPGSAPLQLNRLLENLVPGDLTISSDLADTYLINIK